MSYLGQSSRGAVTAAPQPQERAVALPVVDPARRRFLVVSDGRAGSILETARQLGELRGLSTEEVGVQTAKNFYRFFSLHETSNSI